MAYTYFVTYKDQIYPQSVYVLTDNNRSHCMQNIRVNQSCHIQCRFLCTLFYSRISFQRRLLILLLFFCRYPYVPQLRVLHSIVSVNHSQFYTYTLDCIPKESQVRRFKLTDGLKRLVLMKLFSFLEMVSIVLKCYQNYKLNIFHSLKPNEHLFASKLVKCASLKWQPLILECCAKMQLV